MVRHLTDNGEFSKVLVECHDDLQGFASAIDDFLVARIGGPVRDGFDFVTGVLQNSRRPSPDARVEEHLHGNLAISQRRFNAFVTDDASGIEKAGPNVFGFKPGVTPEDCFGSIARCKHPKDVLDGQSMSSDDRLAAEDLGVGGNACQKVGFVVHCPMTPRIMVTQDAAWAAGCPPTPSQRRSASRGRRDKCMTAPQRRASSLASWRRRVGPSSVQFGPAGATITNGSGHLEDVDGDGDLDLVLHFLTGATGIACGDDTASLSGETFEGQPIAGSDSVRTVPCK